MSTIALAGSPNCGKTALFNALTGGRQRVGNYAGVTVERKEGFVTTPSGKRLAILDLPGTYSLDARTLDESVTRDVVLGLISGEASPEVLVAVADATNLERSLGLVLELVRLGKPTVLALNMMDLAKHRGLELDLDFLSKELSVPVVPTVAVKNIGIPDLLGAVESKLASVKHSGVEVPNWKKPTIEEIKSRYQEVDRILKNATRRQADPNLWTDRIDQIVTHPVWGTLILATVLALMFQALFAWAKFPMELIQSLVGNLGGLAEKTFPAGALKNLLVEGVIAGVGSVLVFLPQILILFGFILLLEDSGYMARAAFLMDRLMRKVGLNGKAFIPLLSSHSCAIPGIMAARTIEDTRDRLTTILVAPLTTCSARLPVYSLLIAAFIPSRKVFGFLGLQGFFMFGLYVAGVLASLTVASVMKRSIFKGAVPPLLLELPTYKWPSLRNIVVGMIERAWIFVRRAGTVILSLSILLWFLTTYPKAPTEVAAGAQAEPAIHFSYAGKFGRAIEPLIKPLGFDWRVGIALVPGFAAREVFVSALGTVYAVEAKEGDEEAVKNALQTIVSKEWPLATALSLFIWYIFAPQCLSTIAVVRRETNSWKWAGFLVLYMTSLAYFGSFAMFHFARALGWG